MAEGRAPRGHRDVFGTAGRRGATALLVSGVLILTGAAAIAAQPKKGAHFAGTTSGVGINGFKQPVTFTVSSDGKTLTHFTYSTLGCFGSGGFQPGVDYFTRPYALKRIGTVKISRSGHFSVSGAVSVYTSNGYTTTTTSSVSGSFTSPTAASLTVTFTQKLSSGATCASGALHFTAKS